MQLAISNIGWPAEKDAAAYGLMKKYGFTGLEIAPTRIFPERPYERLAEAEEWRRRLGIEYGFVVPSMQSIWFGRKESIFGTEEERRTLLEYTKKAIDFAENTGCGNLVFGCPKNRNLPEGAEGSVAVPFFRELGKYAAGHNTVIGLEANPPIYHTNYINDTWAAFRLIKEVNSEGFRLNLDVGTMIQNGEDVEELAGKTALISHVHISEPGLQPIRKRQIHKELREVLLDGGYQGFVSVEMGKTETLDMVEEAMRYVKEIFGQ